MKQILPVLTLIVVFGLGWMLAGISQSSNDDDIGTEEQRNGELSVPKLEFDETVGRLKKQISTLKADLAVARDGENNVEKSNSELLARIAELEKIKEQFEASTSEKEKGRAKRMAAIENRFKELSSMGIQALVSNNEIGKLVADLLQEGEQGHAAVLALLQSKNDDERMLGIVLMMQGMASDKSVDPLANMALEGTDETMKAMASQALLRMKGEAAVSAMERVAAETKDEGVKVNTLFGLASNGHEKGVQQLLDYYNDPDSSHRDVLTGSLLILRNPESQPLIDAVVERHKDRGEGTRNRIGEAAIGYYKAVNNEASKRALQAMADDPTASSKIRQMAQDALSGN